VSVDHRSPEFTSNVCPDPADDRDRTYTHEAPPGYVRPAAVGYQDYQRYVGTTWHQRGEECTGFALAAIANFLVRRHYDDPDLPSVSRRMMYEVAQMYDHEVWREGSTCRAALKGWSRTGAALDELWPYDPNDEDGSRHGTLTLARLLDARIRPLLSYSRIDGSDVGTMQDALAAGHPLYVSAKTHDGWTRLYLPDVESVITRRPDDTDRGFHAFVIAGYDPTGFWVHNSWGPEWGTEGYAILTYEEWKSSSQDVWVVEAEPAEPAPAATSPSPAEVTAYRDLWQHLVVLRDDGKLASSGLYEMDERSLKTLFYLFKEQSSGWERPRLAIIADGGALPTSVTIDRFRLLRDRFMAEGIYPLFVVWETSWWSDLDDDLHRWARRLADAASGPTDQDVIERSVAGLMWHQIRARSIAACAAPSGGGHLLVERVRYRHSQKPFDLHLLSVGAGDLLMAELARLFPVPLATATTLASASTMETFARSYADLLDTGRLQHMSVIVEPVGSPSEGLGPLPMSFLELVSGVRADAGEAAVDEEGLVRRRLLGLGADVDDDPTVARLRTTDCFVVRPAPPVAHVDLITDESLVALIIEEMLGHESASSPAPDPSEGEDGDPLPSDPLARAEVLRARAITDPLARAMQQF
jgi:Papain family cysteine protease